MDDRTQPDSEDRISRERRQLGEARGLIVETITIEELHRRFESQKAKSKLDLKVICPICKKTQSGQDLIDAGAGKSFEDVEKFIGFSCVGRWLNAGPFKKNNSKGCDWTLGGLFKLHTLEVVNLDGVKQPFFEVANGEQP